MDSVPCEKRCEEGEGDLFLKLWIVFQLGTDGREDKCVDEAEESTCVRELEHGNECWGRQGVERN